MPSHILFSFIRFSAHFLLLAGILFHQFWFKSFVEFSISPIIYLLCSVVFLSDGFYLFFFKERQKRVEFALLLIDAFCFAGLLLTLGPPGLAFVFLPIFGQVFLLFVCGRFFQPLVFLLSLSLAFAFVFHLMGLQSMEDRLIFSVLFNLGLVLTFCFGLLVLAIKFFKSDAVLEGQALEGDQKPLPLAMEMSLNLAGKLKPFLNSMAGHFKREESVEKDPILFKNSQRLVENARKFILDFIEYAQPDMDLNMEESIDLKNLLQDLLQTDEIQRKRPKNLLQEALWPKEPLKIKGSSEGLKKGLSHVLINAYESVKNSKAQPKVRIQAHKEFFLGRPYAGIKVLDNGEGIPPEDMKQIFNPFFSNRIGGLRGVGLAYTKKMIEAHKGQIDIKSFAGKGVEVLIQLPLERDFLPPFKKVRKRLKTLAGRKSQEESKGESKDKSKGEPKEKPVADPDEKRPPPAA